MRILLSDTWASGGASTFVAILARGLRRRGHEVDVVLGYRTSAAVDAYRDVVGRVFSPPSAFSAVVLAGHYDVVHITEADLGAPFEYARRIRALGLPTAVIVTSHVGEGDADLSEPADMLVFVSNHAREAASPTGKGVAVVPNGVDGAHLAAIADAALVEDVNAPLAVWVGRVVEHTPQKDFLGFGYALNSLLEAGWEVLVLDGAPPSKIAPAADQLYRWFGERVRYANQVPPGQVVGALLRAAQTGGALISTSRVEGAPFVALEALALGCSVIAPRIDGYRPLLEAGVVSGYNSLADLLQLISTRDFRQSTASLPEHLTADAMTARYLELYAEALRPPSNTISARMTRLAVRARHGAALRALSGATRQ